MLSPEAARLGRRSPIPENIYVISLTVPAEDTLYPRCRTCVMTPLKLGAGFERIVTPAA
jgi:hypothetical protein